MNDYVCEKKENRLTIFYKGKFFIDVENTHQLSPKDFLKSYGPVLDDIRTGEYDGETLEVILQTLNANYKGQNYKRGQLSIYDL